ncbi:MAG: M23 family metallopeptidase [Treponema sp.]|jgi:murein DD-endopeptidase MepM/ murein hydrolase activator NlpD|nr:M23 family metallopeptidase [Treponema sp.]
MTRELLIQQQVKRQRYVTPPIGEQSLKEHSERSSVYALQRYDLPIGSNTNPLIQQIKQNPISPDRYKRNGSSGAVSRAYMPNLVSSANTQANMRVIHSDIKPAPLPRQGLHLALLVPLFVIGGLVAFSIIALNWPEAGVTQRLALFPWSAGTISLEPGTNDKQINSSMEFYAGLSTSTSGVNEIVSLNIMETFEWEEYIVQRGDTISGIAQEYALSMDAIIASNNITNAGLLRIGEKLKIPNMDGIPYTVKRGDTLEKISKTMGVPFTAILDANDIQDSNIKIDTVLFIPGAKMKKDDLNKALGISIGGESFVYPIRGRLTSPFGWRDDPITGARTYHTALDIAAALGTPIKASMKGTVSSAGQNAIYGKFVIITHSNGYQSMYGHMSAISVAQGTSVDQGVKIGEVGSTGRSTGPHLHFALFKNGRAVDPLEFLK